ncbi:MAG: 5-formyltetrahydrofolate cyclo-ligase [Cyclobacteriaceae bacterium]|nr:5-formyltetrahydrofolate cyclo-ligase [Cyclobacteriaceae bacterium]
MTKSELRKLYLQKRKVLSEAEYLALNHRLTEVFFSSVDLSFINVLHTFLPVVEKREPDTWLIIDRIRREFPHVRLSIPRVNTETDQLENFYFEGLHQLKKNNWGILEPTQGIPTPPEKIDMVLIPLLAFDNQGNRVGYGKGYYDRFLGSCPQKTKKIGISFFSSEEEIPSTNSDEQLDHCITPTEVYIFHK